MADMEKNDTAHASMHVADIAAIAGQQDDSITNKAIVNAAEDSNEFDHKLRIKDAVSYYRWAIFWCLMISMTVVMEGYGTPPRTMLPSLKPKIHSSSNVLLTVLHKSHPISQNSLNEKSAPGYMFRNERAATRLSGPSHLPIFFLYKRIHADNCLQDTILIGNFYAFPEFQKKYGRWVGVTDSTRSGYQLEPAWQAGVGNGAGVGAFFGAVLNGWLVNHFGQKRTIIASLCFLSGTIFLTFFAQNIQTLLAGQILCGLPWGVFATSAPAYASEMLPMVLRIYFTSWTNMCFIGQLIAAGLLRGCLEREDEWAFRIPFAIQWAWPIMLIPVLCFAPESPWHLVRNGQHTKAEAVLRRLQRPEAPIDPKQTLATIIYTNNLEEELSVGTSYKNCFQSFEKRRTEIACVCFAGQVICGSQFAYSATYFWEQVGLESDIIYNLNIVGTSVALIAATCSWLFLMPNFGRRTIYMSGVGGMATTLIVIGIMNTWVDRRSVGLAQAALTVVWKFFFQLSVGQLGWAIPAEVGSTRLRQKTIVLARNSYYISQVVANVLQPYFMNPSAWNLRGYTGFVWGGTAILIFTWCWFRLPETKGRTFEELDVLFADKVPAKKFKKTEVNAFDHSQTDALKHLYAH